MRREIGFLLLAACQPTFYQPKDTEDTGTGGDSALVDTGESGDSDSALDTQDSTETAETGDSDTEPPVEATDFTVTGPETVFTWAASLDSASCYMSYDVYAPNNYAGEEVVILTHGFSRSKANMVGWAEHLASWGLTVVTPTLCSVYDHAANGRDLVLLADEITTGSVLYAGHSAGALASVLAATQDPDAISVIGLDLVDIWNLGVAAAPSLSVPVAGLVGVSSACNSKNNGLAVWSAASDTRVLSIGEADHCDFENPTDAACQMFCPGTNTAFTDEQIQRTLTGLLTSWVMWKWNLDETGEMYWIFGNEPYNDMLAAGAIDEL